MVKDDGQKEFEIALAKAIDDADKDVVKRVYCEEYPVDEKGMYKMKINLFPVEIQVLLVSLYMFKIYSDAEKEVFDQVLKVYKDYRQSDVSEDDTLELVISFLELEVIMLALYEFKCNTDVERGLLESLELLHKKCKVRD